MEGCVSGSYFGRSPNGWMSAELFFGWVANHFARHVTERPVILLVDGHSTHVDVEVSKFCRDNSILLYCIPPHTSHVLQPLDVGFYSSLKNSWSKACDRHKIQNPGVPVNKYSFAGVFHEAWTDCVKVSVFVNAFRQSSICPLNPQAIDKTKLGPSAPISTSAGLEELPSSKPTEVEALHKVESLMKDNTLSLYKQKFEEGYDLECESDELYCVWSKLKQLSISESKPVPKSENTALKILPEKQYKVSSVVDEVLTYPVPTEVRKPSAKGKGTSELPKHLSSDQVIDFLQKR